MPTAAKKPEPDTTTPPAPDPAPAEAPAPSPAPVHAAWAAVMAEVRAVGKNDAVTTGPARFNFRGIDGVLNAVGPVFRKHGVYVTPIGVDVLATEHNPTRSGGLMKNVTISVTWRVTGPAGDTFTGVSLGEGSDAGDKAISKAHSVAFRTFLIQSLALPTDEPDPDHTIYERAPSAPGGYGGGYGAPAPGGPAPKDWGPFLARAEAKTTEAELRELWDAEPDTEYAPAWVTDRFSRAIANVRTNAANPTTSAAAPAGA